MNANALTRSRGHTQAWYNTVLTPALTSFAARQGQDMNTYLGNLNEAQFLQIVNQLAEGFKPDTPGLFSNRTDKYGFINSQYPGMKRLVGTNLLVEANQLRNGQPDSNLIEFINDYKTGRLQWYRGVAIGHFGWSALELHGVLASEGTADTPTFTMGNVTPTRWLPGDNDRGTAQIIAQSVSSGDTGLRDLMERSEFPTGAIVKYHVPPTAPVAYLNSGEQVVRGPTAPGDVIVDAVCVLGPAGFRETALNSAATDLPPRAPYQAAIGAPALTAWERQATAWLALH